MPSKKAPVPFPDIEGRRRFDFTGNTYNDLPVSNTFARLEYKINDMYYEEGCYDDK